MKTVSRKNSKNAAGLVINNNHFHLHNAFEKVPRNSLTFEVMHQITEAKRFANVMLRLQI